jgi:hypothetical protein
VNFDAVLIDNERAVMLSWKLMARQYGKSLLWFRSVEEFLAKQATFDRDQVIYIDSDLGDDVPAGQYEAKRISELGFKSIYLATGHSSEWFPQSRFPWLTGVRGKESPWSGDFEAKVKALLLSSPELLSEITS